MHDKNLRKQNLSSLNGLRFPTKQNPQNWRLFHENVLLSTNQNPQAMLGQPISDMHKHVNCFLFDNKAAYNAIGRQR